MCVERVETMSLRRLAQENHAGVTGSPRSSSQFSPRSPLANPPTTPRSRVSLGVYRSPASTPSISSSVPFDWEAARSLRPPPYATPRGKATRTSHGTSPRKAVVRKKSLYEKSVWLLTHTELGLKTDNLPQNQVHSIDHCLSNRNLSSKCPPSIP